MIEFAEAELALSEVDENGVSVREHLQQAERSARRRLPELHPDPPPSEFAYLWRWFVELSAARGSTGWSVLPISYSEIQAWSVLTGRQTRPWEVSVIRRIDQIFIRRVRNG